MVAQTRLIVTSYVQCPSCLYQQKSDVLDFEWEEAVSTKEEGSNTLPNDNVYEEPRRFRSTLNVMSKRWDGWWTLRADGRDTYCGRTALKWILKVGPKLWTSLIWLKIVISVTVVKSRNEFPSSAALPPGRCSSLLQLKCQGFESRQGNIFSLL